MAAAWKYSFEAKVSHCIHREVKSHGIVTRGLSQNQPHCHPEKTYSILSSFEDVYSIYGLKPIYNTFYIYVHSIMFALLTKYLF